MALKQVSLLSLFMKYNTIRYERLCINPIYYIVYVVMIKMAKYLVYNTFLITLIFAITFTSLLSPFDYVVSQIDPLQEQIEPIPPSNNTNQTAPIVTFYSLY